MVSFSPAWPWLQYNLHTQIGKHVLSLIIAFEAHNESQHIKATSYAFSFIACSSKGCSYLSRCAFRVRLTGRCPHVHALVTDNINV